MCTFYGMPELMKVLWRRVESPGLEACELRESARGHSLRGVVVLLHARDICRLEYEIACSPTWDTKTASITGYMGDRRVSMRLKVDSKKHWYVNGKRASQVDGCIDIDLGFSPSTNLLPIRRLRLRRGVPVAITACWVAFPSLEVKPLPQTYERRGPTLVHYESAGGRFQRDLETRANGMVVSYPGLWEAETPG